MVNWYVDESLQQFDRQWLEKFPGATIYHIGDSNHSTNPDVSQHAPDRGGSKPGDDKGEVDAGDYMQGKGVTITDLRGAFADLHRSRDPRIFYCILEDKIFSSVVRPWEIRPYKGKFHNHLHVSVNDDFDANRSIWEALVMDQTWDYKNVDTARLPVKLVYGMDDDAYVGMNHVMRAQALINLQDKTLDPLDCDGVYGGYTVQKVKKVFGGNGKTLTFENLKKLHGFN